ncbi:MAG: DUF4383 domain-containing protein [bacterium]|nr:DUF4383 domain-containing protein [bacterium]
MLRTMAKVFGAALLAAGIMGFFSVFTPNDNLLGLFHVNALHNLVHFSSGAVALWAGFTSVEASRKYFQIFGIIYALLTVVGIFYGNNDILGIVAHNTADIFLHIGISGTALILALGRSIGTLQPNKKLNLGPLLVL